MNSDDAQRARESVDPVYLTESRRILATLIRLLGHFDLAEEALHDAFNAAIEQWPRDEVPANPRAWLVSAGRFKAIDGIRRNARFTPLGDDAEDLQRLTMLCAMTKTSTMIDCASSSPAAIRRFHRTPKSH